jgi:putative transposase
MPRKPRIRLTDVPQHVIQRGNNRNPCFYAGSDYQCYLDALGEALLRHECRLHAYVLMTNHVHLLVTPTSEFGISWVMQDTGRKFVRYINRKYSRTGTLWEGRYKACVIDSDAWLLTCMRYIEMNPVRAGMVSHPGEYRWSSYGMNACGRDDQVVRQHGLYLALGQTRDERLSNYRQLFSSCLEACQVQAIRKALYQELVLGREDFKDVIERMTQRQVRRGTDGRPRAGKPPCGEAVHVYKQKLGSDPG